MKTFFTSCYGRSRSLPPELTQVRTSRGVPEWWKPALRIDALPFAPSQAIMAASKANPNCNWRGHYRRQLEDLYKSGVLERVVDQLPDKSVLLCFEANACDCHRAVLGAFLVEKGLANVSEYQTVKTAKPEPPKDRQQLLL